jgi:hypothetical protein
MIALHCIAFVFCFSNGKGECNRELDLPRQASDGNASDISAELPLLRCPRRVASVGMGACVRDS